MIKISNSKNLRTNRAFSLRGLAFAGVSALSLSLTPSSDAAVWYLHATQSSGQNYNTPSFWFDAPTGGTAATSLNSSDTYDTNGFNVRSVEATSTPFAGGTLSLSSSSVFILKNLNQGVANLTIASTGGSTQNGTASTANVNGTNLVVNGAFTVNTAGATGGRKTAFNYTNVSGAGNMTLLGSNLGFVDLGFTNANNYSGTIFSTDGTQLDFTSSFATGGGLNIATGTRVLGFAGITVTFNALTIAGNAIAQGTYTYAQLQSSYASIFSPNGANPAGGTIVVVPEPATWMLIGAAGLFLVITRARSSARRRAAIGA